MKPSPHPASTTFKPGCDNAVHRDIAGAGARFLDEQAARRRVQLEVDVVWTLAHGLAAAEWQLHVRRCAEQGVNKYDTPIVVEWARWRLILPGRRVDPSAEERRKCDHCGHPLPVDHHRLAKYCGNRGLMQASEAMKRARRISEKKDTHVEDPSPGSTAESVPPAPGPVEADDPGPTGDSPLKSGVILHVEPPAGPQPEGDA